MMMKRLEILVISVVNLEEQLIAIVTCRKIHGIFLNKNILFIDSMQFKNSSLDNLVKNLSDKDFQYLVEQLSSENLELLKPKGAYPYECMNSFERFNEKK